jgi:peptidoglycan/LPS O-acetylase OafA/YrhL
MSEIDKKYFPSLDGLRAISVFLVTFVHLKYHSALLVHLPGWLGVDFFFIISGFLITTLLLREERDTSRVDLFAFYARRFFRIVPIYSLVLAVYVAACLTDAGKWAQLKHALPYYLTFTNEFVANHVPFSATWTLGIEEKFYLVWPFLFFVLLAQFRKRLFVLPILFALTALLPFRMARSYFGLLVGCTVAILFAYRPDWLKTNATGKWRPFALLGLISFCFYLVDRNEKFVFLFSICAALLVVHLLTTRDWLEMLLSSDGFVWVGRRSYSMYLIHSLVLDTVQRLIVPVNTTRQIVVVILSFGICALCSDVLFRFIEEPARRAGKRVLSKRHRVLGEPTPVVNGMMVHSGKRIEAGVHS